MASEEPGLDVWTSGSYADVGVNFLPMAAHLVDAAGVESGQRVLDVACGTGNVAVTAARRGAAVTGLDLTRSMLEGARANAALANVDDVAWRQGDAAALPFDGDGFDATLSSVGHVFASPPEAVAAELLRVTRPGGRIAFTVWSPDGVVTELAATLQAYLSSTPETSPAPAQWTDADAVRSWLGGGVSDLASETGAVEWPSLSPEHFWEALSTTAGAFVAGLAAVDEAERPALRAEMIEAVEAAFDDGANAVPMAYRLTSATVA